MSSHDEIEAILYAFAVEAKHDRTTFERYLRQYPELSQELTDLLSELRLDEAALHAPDTATRDWSASWQRFRACKPNPATIAVAVSPFERFRGAAFVSLARTLNVSRSFLTAFRDGLVVASSIPDSFVSRFANATGLTAEAVRNFFSQPPTVLLGRQFKADNTPAHQGQKTFEELVRASDMTEEQRRTLLEDDHNHGLDRGKPTES
jgi:hypothetical protein